MSAIDDLQHDLTDIRQPDPLLRAAARIEAVAQSILPRIVEVEKRQERQEGAMATHRDLSEAERAIHEKVERGLQQLGEDIEKLEKGLTDHLKVALRDVLPEFMPDYVRQELERIREIERKQDREILARQEAEKEAARRAIQTRLAIIVSAISIATTIYVVARYAMQVI